MRLLLLLLLLVAFDARAWAEFGHRVVAELAERQLSPSARAAVAELLADEADPTLAGVAAWADEVREARLPAYEHTRAWHFVNFPSLDCEYVAERECPNGDCIIGAIVEQQRILADTHATLQRRREALKFLVHFLGDVHQPLHAGLVADRGGNGFQVRVNGEGSNLHKVWDFVLLQDGPRGVAAYVLWLEQGLAAVDSTPSARRSAPVPALAWALESCRLLRSAGVYPERRRVGKAYLDRMRPLAERRLQQAAKRLAELIEAALGG